MTVARARASAAACALLLLLPAARARADLASDARTLEREWRGFGEVTHLAPMLLERGQVRPLLLFGARDERETDCTTVAVIGAPSSTFVLRFLPPPDAARWREWDPPEKSEAGAAQLVRCGPSKAKIGRLAIEMRSPRGVFEILVSTAAEPMPSLRSVLPQREPGPPPKDPDLGPDPRAVPLPEWARRTAERAKLDGAARVDREPARAESDGTYGYTLTLAAGCHELFAMAEPGRSRQLDVDAELYALPSGEVMVSDRSDATDAKLSLCLPSSTEVLLKLGGMPPNGALEVVRARYPLPTGLPAAWGASARASMAETLWAARARPPDRSPIYSSLGVTGTTSVAVEVEPGACYRAAVTVLRGEPAGIGLSALVGSREAQNHGGPGGSGAVLAFCAPSSERAAIEVEAHGAGVVWLLALWQNGRSSVGEASD